jgi:murein DD-endopeptidase MepM/ murein hydrolase activator NlpD
MNRISPRALYILFFTLTLCTSLYLASVVNAQSLDDIQSKIVENSTKIQDLQKEIAAYQKQLVVIGGQKQTLQSQLQALEISRKKILAQSTITKNKIASANLTLNKLALNISDKSKMISLDKKSLAQSFRGIRMNEETTFIERLLNTDSLTEGWIALDQSASVNKGLQQHAKNVTAIKDDLTVQQSEVIQTKNELSSLEKELTSQQEELEVNKKATQQLLGQTKAKESNYKSIIAKKRSQQKAFESELSSLENSLKAANPANIPRVGSGVLVWPFPSSVMESCKKKSGAVGNPFCITQYFGNTAFSTSNPQIYNGSGHNAIDLGVPSGTQVIASLSGTIMGTGNTDSIPGCYSYGKWVLIKHANGLATLYAHLSSISVSSGQSVDTGSTIGYSGMTGYATGPHLHFGVYASDATKILTLQQYRGATSPCATAAIPVASKSAYLNPMSYL